MPPDLHPERSCGSDRVAGVDEVGRGPLAGPVLAACVMFTRPPPTSLTCLIDDSKRLDAVAREDAFAAFIASPCVRFGVGAASAAEIGAINILQATYLAMRRAVAALGEQPDLVLIDGNRGPALAMPTRCIVGGDALSLSIAAASIVAKVLRDRAMMRLATRWPGYAWQTNMGYPTAAHRTALASLGPTPHHRRGFAPVEHAFLARG